MAARSDLRIAQPLTLKCGLTLPNRLVKAAMAEALADSQSLPSERLMALYKHWSESGWGLIITGNVQVDSAHLGQPTDVAITPSLPDSAHIPAFSAWARVSRGSSATDGAKPTPVIVQINHPGRQSPRGAGTRGLFTPPMAPSAIPLSLGQGWVARLLQRLLMPAPREMAGDEVAGVVAQFARAARVVAEAGFDGVEIHGAHGYLVSQFLGAPTNRRADAYGGSPAHRARFAVDVVRAVREITRAYDGFCVGIKLNSVDHQREGELDEFVQQVRMIVEAGVDFVEVSGGSYEDPQMSWGPDGPHPEQKSERTKAREAFFLDFAQVIRKEFPDVPLIVTGGFSTRIGMEKAVADGACDLIGLARPAAANPSLPRSVIFNSELKDQDATLYRKKNSPGWIVNKLGISAVGAGMDSQWYTEQLHKFADLSTP
ncbi:hypothetical protein MFIFM68171_05001 [Madurella fahalii]|uniref:NADH:flavin oxidoreductase/NADH oxidase N-terminal domain-containing protein n=1 Tax=Madurella fahalii TaxID=1157608 RepID=A0ABQ0GAJ4_9PEZI